MAARASGISESIAAIAYGIDNGAKIISMSWGYYQDYPNLHNEIDSAWNEGLLLVASAGNNSIETPRYPAAYENVIAVAGTDSNDVKNSYSNYGTWVDICAPWDNWSPGRVGKWWTYCYYSIGGTSISAPFVAGVAAMVWSCNHSATNAQVRAALENTADNICGIPGNYNYCYPVNKLGHGRVNALEAVKVFRPYPPPPGDCTLDYQITVSDAIFLLNYLYHSGPPPDPYCVGNVNGDTIIDIGDAMYILNFLFHNGPPPQDGCI
jgi:subtilisin family serine protease